MHIQLKPCQNNVHRSDNYQSVMNGDTVVCNSLKKLVKTTHGSNKLVITIVTVQLEKENI